jgi:hypothetical protein
MSTGKQVQRLVPPMAGASQCLEKQLDLDINASQNEEAVEAGENLKQQAHGLWVMEGAGTRDVTVVVRVRPLSLSESRQRKTLITHGATVRLLGCYKDSAGELNTCHDSISTAHKVNNPQNFFTFNAVMSESCTTEHVFSQTGCPAVTEVVRGVSALVIAYGPTGSGKTYTLLGQVAHGICCPVKGGARVPTHCGLGLEGGSFDDADMDKTCENVGERGIAVMTFEMLLQRLKQRAQVESKEGDVTYTIEVSALQVYRKKVYDLLSEDVTRVLPIIFTQTVKETLTEHGREECDVHHAHAHASFIPPTEDQPSRPEQVRIPCKDVAEFQTVLQCIVAVRKQGSTQKNNTSSRSHLIITLAVRRNVNIRAEEVRSLVTYISTLSLVDLAGNERDSDRKDSANEAVLRSEGIDVALSLSALSACLRQRARNSSVHQSSTLLDLHNAPTQENQCYAGPYRTSTLTRLLRESLTSAKIFFLACCSPAAADTATTGQTLVYAANVKRIKTNAEDSAMLHDASISSFPIEFLPHKALVKYGCIPRSHEEGKKYARTVYLCELRTCVVRIFVSHRWLSPSMDKQLAGPDDGDNNKHKLLCELFGKLMTKGWIRNYDVVEWIDYGAGCVSAFLNVINICKNTNVGFVMLHMTMYYF